MSVKLSHVCNCKSVVGLFFMSAKLLLLFLVKLCSAQPTTSWAGQSLQNRQTLAWLVIEQSEQV